MSRRDVLSKSSVVMETNVAIDDLKDFVPSDKPLLDSTSSDKDYETNVVILDSRGKIEPTFGYPLLLLFGTLNFAMSYGMPTSLSAFFLDWQETFQVNRASTATVHATCLGILNTGAIIPGYLMNRFGARPTLLVGSLLATTSLILTAFATSITYLVFTVGLMGGLGFCMLNLPVIPSVTQAFTSHRSIIISCLSFGSSISNTGLIFLYRYMSNQLSWRGAFLVLGGVSLNTCVTGLIITSYYRRPESQEISKLQEDKLPVKSDSSSTNSLNSTDKNELDLAGGRNSDDISRKSASLIHNGESVKYLDACLHPDKSKSIDIGTTLPLNDEKCSSSTDDDSERSSDRTYTCISKLRHSKFLFVLDPLYLLIVVNTAICIPATGTLIYLILDFARNKGFPDESAGVFFLFIAFLLSAIGKLLSGFLNLFPYRCLRSVYILTAFGLTGSFTLTLLTFVSGYYEVAVALALLGLCFGGLSGIYPKCILDMSSVDARSFPLALGIANSVEGIFDSAGPILMGFLVDVQGHYTLPLLLFAGCASTASISLLIVYLFQRRRS